MLIPVGPPGIGKSTWVQTATTKVNAVVCSSDEYLELWALVSEQPYSEVFEDNIKFAEQHFKTVLANAIQDGRNIIIDRTNMSAKRRAGLIEIAKNADYKVEAFLFKNVTWTKWVAQLKGRTEKTISPYVIGSMLLSYDEPSREEGFDDVYYL